MKRLIFILLLLSPFRADAVTMIGFGSAAGGYMTPAFKGVVEGTGTSDNFLFSATGTLNIATGDLVVAQASGAADISAVTCGVDSLIEIKSNDAESFFTSMWYKENATANASATCTATYANGTTNYVTLFAANYSGIALSSSLDKSSCNEAACNAQTDSATTRTAQNVTTVQTYELLVFVEIDWDDKATYTKSGSWVKRTAAGTKGWVLLDNVVTSTGSYPGGTVVTVPDTADDGYYSILATFKARAN